MTEEPLWWPLRATPGWRGLIGRGYTERFAKADNERNECEIVNLCGLKPVFINSFNPAFIDYFIAFSRIMKLHT